MPRDRPSATSRAKITSDAAIGGVEKDPRVRTSPRSNARRVAGAALRPVGIEPDVELLAGQATDRRRRPAPDVARASLATTAATISAAVAPRLSSHASQTKYGLLKVDPMRISGRGSPERSELGLVGGRVREQPVEIVLDHRR